MAAKRSIAVQIAGHKIVLRSDVDDKTVHALAAHVDRRVQEIHKASRGTVDSQQVMILAALQIAEELHNEKESALALKKQIRDRGRTLLKLLERTAGV